MIRRVVTPPQTWVRAVFSIMVENMTLEQITERLNESPDGGGILRQEVAQMQFDADTPLCGWLLRSRIDPRALAGEHVADLLERLEHSKTELGNMVSEGALAEFTICVLGDDFSVPFALATNTVGRVAEIPASLRVFF